MVSIWQVYPDAGSAVTPILIVMFDDAAAVPTGATVTVVVGGTPLDVRPSTTTANGIETTVGVADWDVVAVSIGNGSEVWALDPIVVPPAPTSMLPMRELIYASSLLTAGAGLWFVTRATRGWRRSLLRAS